MNRHSDKPQSSRPRGLPEFERPPIHELVLAIQFAPLTLRNIDMGSIWELFRDKYPNVEENPPLAPIFETFGMPPAPVEGPRIMFSTNVDVNRYWFITRDGNELLQVQPDRLIHNWRLNSPEAVYPRYEPIRERFESEARTLQKFLSDREFGEIKPNQSEVSYINHITLGESVEPSNRFDDVFTVWKEEYSDDYLKRVERTQFSMSYVILGDSEQPFGRLHVVAQPLISKKTSQSLIRLSLTVRGKPKDETIPSAFEWLDKGREVVVRAFAALTRPELHKVWGRTNA